MKNFEVMKRAIENDIVSFFREDDTLICKIGINWFYFLDDDETAEKFLEKTVEEQAQTILNVFSDYEKYGLDESEIGYYEMELYYFKKGILQAV